MPNIQTAGPEARSRLVTGAGRGKGYQERTPYRQAIRGLSGDEMLEIAPDEGESLRQIRMRVARAAREVDTEVRSGETQDGTLLVWLSQPAPRRRRGRRPTAEATPAAGPAP